jgi:hypothetical protein
VLFTYTGFLRNRFIAATVFSGKEGKCISNAILGLSDALNVVGVDGEPIPTKDQDVGNELGACSAKAIKGLLGLLLNLATR